MGKLTQVAILSILQTMIQDDDFVESLADCIKMIFDISPPNLRMDDPFQIVVDRIMKYFELHTEMKEVEIPGIRSTLIGMLKEKQFLAFARNLMMLENILEYTTARIVNFLKQLKFRTKMNGKEISPWIDVQSTAEAIIEELHPEKMRIFAGLSREERCLMQGFTSEQIAVMSKFSPKGIVILSKLGHLPPDQRSMILGLDQNEGRLFKDLGFQKIRSISGARFFGMKEGQSTLQKLIEREAVVIESMTEEAGTLAEGIHDLTLEEREKYLNLSPREVETLNDMNDEYRNEVLSFRNLNEVLNVAKNLHPSQRDLILSLRRGEIDALLGHEYGESFNQIQRILRDNPLRLHRSCPLLIADQDAILALEQQQRLVLAKAYDLGRDGLFMIRQLGPELTRQVLDGKKELSVMQTALKKKLVNVNCDRSILSQLFEIMEHRSWAILLDLNWTGIQLLSRTANLDEEMIGYVKKLSDNGMVVLLSNDRLTGTEIMMLGNLDPTEGNVLINLNLDQRHYLSDKTDLNQAPTGIFDTKQLTTLKALSDAGQSVLKRIVLLSDDEHLLLRGSQELNTGILTSMFPVELNLLASLSYEKFNLLSSFMFRRVGEYLISEFFRIPLVQSYGDKIGQIRRLLRSLHESRIDHHYYTELIAGAIEVLRLNGVVTDDAIREIIPMIEEPTLSLLFKVNLLKFSVRDSASLVPQLSAQIEGPEVDIMSILRFNPIRTIEDLMFVRWILSINDRNLFEIGRGSLIHLSYYLEDGHELEALLSESTSQLDGIPRTTIIENFKHMLSADQHLLANFLFFAVKGESNSDEAAVQVTKMFKENFDADECFQFLNTPASDGFLHGIRGSGFLDILSDARFPNPTILEVCLYHNRGNVLALTEKLDEGQLWKLLENRPLLLLRIMTRNVQVDLIKLFGRVAEVRQVWERNNVEVFQSLIGELRQRAAHLTPEKYLHIARGIRRLTHWPSFLGTDTYITMISEFTKLVQGRVSKRTLENMLDTFVSRDVSREYLNSAIEQRLVISLRNRIRPSCDVMREKREARVMCVDSENTRDLVSETKQRIERIAFDDAQSTLYGELLEYSERKFRGEDLDPQIQRVLMARIIDAPLDSLDPRIVDIVATLDDPEKFETIVKQSGMLNRIEKVAGSTGFAFALFFVGKHIAHGDAESLGYDALNLLILPKIGEKITEVLEKSNPVIGSVLGTTVGNFAAFLGLIDGILDRKNAKSELDKVEADLNIVTNAVFIAANLPAVATRILGEFGVEFAVLGEFGGPVGVALTVPVVIGSYLIGVGLEVEKVTDHIQLTFWEKLSLYWDSFWDHPVPEKFVIDVLAKDVYTEYIANHLRRLNGSYDRIAVSLPSFFITSGHENTTFELDFSHKVRAIHPFSVRHQISRIFPDNVQGYDLVCGPSTRDAVEKILPQNSGQVKELFIPSEPNDDCQNIVSFWKRGSLSPPKTFIYLASDASIKFSDVVSLDMVFLGRNISITAGPTSVNRFYFQYELVGCSIHMKSQNFFYVVGRTFECDLGDVTEEQHNTVVIRSDFGDSSGIHSIVGSERREKIEANFAEFVDGSGGGDLIRATRNTIVKGYVNDLVRGDCIVILPFNVSGIAKLVVHTRMNIFNQNGSWIELDGNARIMTADYYLLTPIRTSNITHHMIRGHIKKTFKNGISIAEELPFLRNLTIPNCQLVKQITSVNCDIVLSDLGQNVFTMDKNGHEYYLEAADHPGSLYIFRKMSVKVTISNANGILDFKELGIDPMSNRVYYGWSRKGGILIIIGGLQVNVLPGYGSVKITFDGKKYFNLGKSGISRDWCSHSLSIVGRVFIDGTDLHNYYNCFEFKCDKIFFFRFQNDLLLASKKQILIISKYYSHIHGETELSLKLQNGSILEAPDFGVRAEQAHQVVYYEVRDSELQIYHNQPVDKHHIGYVDLEHRSINDVEMRIDSGGLLLLYRNSTLVRFENWDYYQPARDMVFVFNDSFLCNAECIFSDCESTDIIEDLKMEKGKWLATNNASRGGSWINDFVNALINPIENYKFGIDFCITSNVNLALVLFQNFLDRKFPIPKPRTIPMVETLTNIINLIDGYETDDNSFELYSNIAELVRNERYDVISKILNPSLSFQINNK